ncbi:MAG: hypothetical protein K0Q50_2900 [Vampirovibrio sp.]|jgi:hypothetical protein|nr:hypothetical protein [Vampirovibrio sp.]
MTPRKLPGKKGLLPKLKSFLDALGDRYQRALQVIDEALASDNLKDKIWAVDLILKRTPAPETEPKSSTSAKPTEPVDTEALAQLSEAELLKRIRDYLNNEPQQP